MRTAARSRWRRIGMTVGDRLAGLRRVRQPGAPRPRDRRARTSAGSTRITPQHELNALQADRAARWQTEPPIRLQRLSQEDQYLDEGLWHVRRRNSAELAEAWRENLILERFFAPVLDRRPTRRRRQPLAPEQRADSNARRAARTSVRGAVSDRAWPKDVDALVTRLRVPAIRSSRDRTALACCVSPYCSGCRPRAARSRHCSGTP